MGAVAALVFGVIASPFAILALGAIEYWGQDYDRAHPDTSYHPTPGVQTSVRQSFRVNMTLEDASGHRWSDTGMLLLILHFGGGEDGIGDPGKIWSISGDTLTFPLGDTTYTARLSPADVVDACLPDTAASDYGKLYEAVSSLAGPCPNARPEQYIVSADQAPRSSPPRITHFLLQPIGYGKGEVPVGPVGPA